jgi:hypothetical protein
MQFAAIIDYKSCIIVCGHCLTTLLVLFDNTVANWLYSIKRQDDSLPMNWKWFEQKWLWPNRGTILYLPWWNEEKLWKSDNHTSPEYNTIQYNTIQYLFISQSEFYYMLSLWNKNSRCFHQFVFILKLRVRMYVCMYTCTKQNWSHCHIHGTLIHVISTVHDTWLDGSPLAWAYFRSSPVTRSHGVPCNADSTMQYYRMQYGERPSAQLLLAALQQHPVTLHHDGRPVALKLVAWKQVGTNFYSYRKTIWQPPTVTSY